MRRRAFIGLVGSATAWPIAALAQQVGRVPLVVLYLTSAPKDSVGQRNASAFRDTFRVPVLGSVNPSPLGDGMR